MELLLPNQAHGMWRCDERCMLHGLSGFAYPVVHMHTNKYPVVYMHTNTCTSQLSELTFEGVLEAGDEGHNLEQPVLLLIRSDQLGDCLATQLGQVLGNTTQHLGACHE